MTEELYALFRRNFPCVLRKADTARELLSRRENTVLAYRDDAGVLRGACVYAGKTVYMLCVDEAYRRKGIGGKLLTEAEAAVKAEGSDRINIGVGNSYLTPGVPTPHHWYETVNAFPDPRLTDEARLFLEKRGYRHDCDADIFDMRMPLSDRPSQGIRPGDAAEGILYRWAEEKDIPSVLACAEDAWDEFAMYYRNAALYRGEGRERVLAAFDGDTACGEIIVSLETEAEKTGSSGCTIVRHAYRGRRIATNLVKAAAEALKGAGMREAALGYTYTGLDKLYGSAGYRISVYYMMAAKDLP